MTDRVRPIPKPAPPRHYIREWRKFRGMTQAELAAAVGLGESSISQLEKFKQGYRQETLEALAEVLHCRPGDLLMRNPTDEEAPWSLLDHLPAEKRRHAMRIIQTFIDEQDADDRDGTVG